MMVSVTVLGASWIAYAIYRLSGDGCCPSAGADGGYGPRAGMIRSKWLLRSVLLAPKPGNEVAPSRSTAAIDPHRIAPRLIFRIIAFSKAVWCACGRAAWRG